MTDPQRAPPLGDIVIPNSMGRAHIPNERKVSTCEACKTTKTKQELKACQGVRIHSFLSLLYRLRS